MLEHQNKMAPTRNLNFIIITLMLISAISTVTNANNPEFSSILFLGDSTVDTGNNNYIDYPTTFLIRANHHPYGKDFEGHVASGRFSNGKLVPDLLASNLKLKHTILPPFLHPNLSDHDLLTGVNFASAGAGFDDLTLAVAQPIPLSKQPDHLRSYAKRLKRIAGEEEAEEILENALVFICAGSNDFLFNFYDIPTRALEYHFNISSYQDFVLSGLQAVIQEVYKIGLRRIAVAGIPPLGCLPIQMTLKLENPNHRKCVKKLNRDVKLYNAKLEKLLSQLQQVLSRSKLVYTDIYTPIMDMVNRPTKYGFEIVDKGCCGSGLVAVGPLCNVLTPTCDNSSKYLFWDAVHPTETAYRYVTQSIEENVLPKFFNDDDNIDQLQPMEIK